MSAVFFGSYVLEKDARVFHKSGFWHLCQEGFVYCIIIYVQNEKFKGQRTLTFISLCNTLSVWTASKSVLHALYLL